MKRFACPIALCVAILLSGPCAALELNAVTGLHYTAWESDGDDDGRQYYIPVHVNGNSDDLAFHLATAYAGTDVKREGIVDGDVSALVDTKAGISYTVKDRLPVDLLLGLDINLPTGETGIEDALRSALSDPDLYPISRFGEGFNLNPTVTVAKSWGQWHAGLGVGYVLRGEYDYTENITDYDPGDIVNIVVEVDFDFSSRWSTRWYVEKAWYGDNEKDGEAYSKSGDFTLFGFSLNHLQANWDASLNLAAVFREKSEYADASGSLVTEEQNSFGDEWNAQAMVRYHYDSHNAFSATLAYLNVQENDYAASSPYFFGEREKYALTLGYSHAFANGLTASLAAEKFTMEDEDGFYHSGDSRTYDGTSFSLLVQKAF
jgi:hypothetical protein